MGGMFKGLNEAQASGDRFPTLTAGSYEVEIASMKVEHTRKLGNCFFLEFVIAKSSNEQHRVGDKRKWMQKLSEDTAFGNLKAFLYALHGRDRNDADDADAIKQIDAKAEEILEAACGPKQTQKGERVGVDVVQVQTKPKEGAPNGFPFQRHNWKPATGE